jgi:arsenate reductase (thioredoxin)
MNTVLFACVHNAGQSQMAAAWFNLLTDPAKARAISAGTDRGTHVHPEVLAAMREVGVDLSGASTTKLTPELAQTAHVLVTMGCGDQCPFVPERNAMTGRSRIRREKQSQKCGSSAMRYGTEFER